MTDTVTSWANSAAGRLGRAFTATVETVKGRDLGEDTKYVATGVSNAVSSTVESVKNRDYVEDSRNAATAVTVGLKSASGAFKQVSKFGEPIYKHVSGGTLGMKQVNTAGKGAIWKPTWFNGWFRGAGKAALTGAVALDAYEIGSAAKEDYDAGTYDKTVVATASVAGAWTGGYSAASVGAFALSWIPGVGSLIGGIGGGVVGAVYGAWGGEAAAKAILPSEENGNK